MLHLIKYASQDSGGLIKDKTDLEVKESFMLGGKTLVDFAHF